MMNRIIDFTQKKKNSRSFLEGFRLNATEMDTAFPFNRSTVEKRVSFRLYSREKKDTLQNDLIKFAKHFEIVCRIAGIPKGLLRLCVLDNFGAIEGNKEPEIYGWDVENEKYVPITHSKRITRQTLFIQDEMHDASVVFFYLWNIEQLSEYQPCFYKDVISISGLLGYQFNLLATKLSYRGTMFAGITLVEYESVFDDYGKNMPVYAFAME